MRVKSLALVAVLGLAVAACGGGSKGSAAKNNALGTTTTTASAAADETTTSESIAPAVTSTTAAGAAQTATTAKATSTSKTTTKPKTVTQVTVAKQLKGGISNITAAPTTVPNKDIQPGGTLLYSTGADIATLDPIGLQNSGNSDAPSAFMVYDMLAYADPLTGEVTPSTMDSLTSTDGVVWILKVRPNIKFTDGTPYDANAVKFNWARLQDPKNAALRAAQANLLSSMDVVDSVTLKLTLKAKNSVFPQAVALMPFIGSPAAITSKGAAFGSDPVGAGPFTLKNWTRDSGMTLVRNPNYWNSPRPYVDQVQTKLIGDISQRMNTFNTSGNANLMYINTAPDADQETKLGGVPNAVVVNGGNLMYFNVRVAPFNDVRVRQAVSMAIDRNDMIKTMDGALIPFMDSIFRHESPFYDPTITQQGYDPVKAQQMFDQFATETGGPLSFTLDTFNVSSYPIAAQYIQAVLNKYRNVKVAVDTAATATQIARVTTGNFTAALYGVNFLDPDPGWTGFFTCSATGQYTGWCDPKFDADVVDQRSTLDPNQRIADLKDAQKIFYAQIPGIFFERKTAWVFSTPAVQDVAFGNDGMPLFDRVWIKTH